MSNIEIQNVDVSFTINNKLTKVLDNVSVSIKQGQFISIIGPSGCGKSTLVSLVAGLRNPAQGQILVDGKEVQGPGLDRGVVFQDYSLFPWMTALENICLGLEQANPKAGRKELQEQAKYYLNLVGLGDFANSYPSQLSGGMQQRIAIARVFALNAKTLLMDEPFGAVDALTRVKLQDLLLKLWEENRKTVLVVTHDIDEALILSDKILVMSNRPAKIHEAVSVPFVRPRLRKEMIRDPQYTQLRAKLVELLHEGMSEDLYAKKSDTLGVAIGKEREVLCN